MRTYKDLLSTRQIHYRVSFVLLRTGNQKERMRRIEEREEEEKVREILQDELQPGEISKEVYSQGKKKKRVRKKTKPKPKRDLLPSFHKPKPNRTKAKENKDRQIREREREREEKRDHEPG